MSDPIPAVVPLSGVTPPDPRLPVTRSQVAAMAAYAVKCNECHAEPYLPCVFIHGSRNGQPRLNYEKAHDIRQIAGDRALRAWQKYSWPNTEQP